MRGGFPRSETLLLAIKAHDYETARPALLAGDTVIEGRSIHTTALYHALILHPDDDAAALDTALRILADAARWRPLPDLTIVLTDDVDAALARAATRDGRVFTDEQRRLLDRAAPLFEHLAALDPARVRLLDRRDHGPDALVDLIAGAPAHTFDGLVPAAALP